jgi:NAD-dependent deacetylase
MIEKLKAWMEAARFMVFFGGAGVSTESAIPDFRSADGLYRAEDEFAHSPEYMLSHDCLINQPDLFYSYYKTQILHPEALPNPAHKALAEWERRGNLKGVITQNIDGLHQMAGSDHVVELHGSVLKNYCLACGKAYDVDFILGSDGIPTCSACGGMVRPDVVLYGEGLEEEKVTEAIRLISQADLLIVGGTSLVVYPAAGLLRYFTGDHLVLINKEATAMDDRADLIFRDPIGQVLKKTIK